MGRPKSIPGVDSDEREIQTSAGDGFCKGDKRRMHNKLVPRVFKAKNEVAGRHVGYNTHRPAAIAVFKLVWPTERGWRSTGPSKRNLPNNTLAVLAI
jgi:hypothetical protein